MYASMQQKPFVRTDMQSSIKVIEQEQKLKLAFYQKYIAHLAKGHGAGLILPL